MYTPKSRGTREEPTSTTPPGIDPTPPHTPYSSYSSRETRKKPTSPTPSGRIYTPRSRGTSEEPTSSTPHGIYILLDLEELERILPPLLSHVKYDYARSEGDTEMFRITFLNLLNINLFQLIQPMRDLK